MRPLRPSVLWTIPLSHDCSEVKGQSSAKRFPQQYDSQIQGQSLGGFSGLLVTWVPSFLLPKSLCCQISTKSVQLGKKLMRPKLGAEFPAESQWPRGAAECELIKVIKTDFNSSALGQFQVLRIHIWPGAPTLHHPRRFPGQCCSGEKYLTTLQGTLFCAQIPSGDPPKNPFHRLPYSCFKWH